MYYGKEEKVASEHKGRMVSFGDRATVTLRKSDMTPEAWSSLIGDLSKDKYDYMKRDLDGKVTFLWNSVQ
jgi:hypothetical protein